MSTNYYIVRVEKTSIPIKEDILVGTRHFTAGQKVFTFVMPIVQFIMMADIQHRMYTEDSTEYMTMSQFYIAVLNTCDKVVYEKGKP